MFVENCSFFGDMALCTHKPFPANRDLLVSFFDAEFINLIDDFYNYGLNVQCWEPFSKSIYSLDFPCLLRYLNDVQLCRNRSLKELVAANDRVPSDDLRSFGLL